MKKSVMVLFCSFLCWGHRTASGAGVVDGQWPVPTPNTQGYAPVKTPVRAQLFTNSAGWIEFYSGYDFSFMGDVGTGTNGWAELLKAYGYNPTGGANNNGLMTGALWGLRLNKTHSLALDLGGVLNLGNNVNIASAGVTASQNCTPILMSASLDYILDLAGRGSYRTYLTAGVGYYHSITSYSLDYNGQDISGTFSGDTFGGTLGMGEEISLGGVGLDFSVRGRYANFSRVSTNTISTNAGTPVPGPYSLTLGNSSGYQVLLVGANSIIDANPGTYKYASLDFSGIDLKIGLNIYLP